MKRNTDRNGVNKKTNTRIPNTQRHITLEKVMKIIPVRVNTQDESVLFLIVVSQSLYVIMLSTFCTWTGSLKQTLFLVNYLNEA